MDDWREVLIEWQGENGFIGSNHKGGSVQLGSVKEIPGASPMELLLMALAGCTGMDVISILEKKRQKLTDFKIRVQGLRREYHPKIYTEINLEFLFWGSNLEQKAIEEAIRLSETKYCSVSAMLQEAAKITIKYEIFPVQET